MMVGGGIVPATNFTRHDVHRPRPPQVAVMSTPPACAARRIVVPGSTSSVRASGRMVRRRLMRVPGYHFTLDFPAALAGIVAKPIESVGVPGGTHCSDTSS